MAEESYEARIAAAEQERAEVDEHMSVHYAGSPEWERLRAKREEWDLLIGELRRQAAQ